MKTKILLIPICMSSAWLFFSSISNSPVPMQTQEWVAPKEADDLVNPFSNNPKAHVEGKNIYESQCWVCHGKSGIGDGPASKGLKPPPANHTSEKVQKQSDGAIFWKMSKGRGQMASYEKILTTHQRWQLVLYIRELGKQKTELH